VPPPGSRSNWPLTGESSDEARTYGSALDEPSGELARQGRVVPPWQSDDLPAEPPALRLVEPAPLTDPALAAEQAPPRRENLDDGLRFEPPALRLVEPTNGTRPAADRTNPVPTGTTAPAGRAAEPAAERLPRRQRREDVEASVSAPPVSDESDGDLLIFAEARSAWFTDHFGEEEMKLDWANASDDGWRAAEQAAQRSYASDTDSGLPRRVPQQNLVPGSPTVPAERPLRIVRDAAAIAAHTTGYFRGWRRGQEVGGYRVGGRPGREAAGGWDFSREQGGDEPDYEYRSARQ